MLFWLAGVQCTMNPTLHSDLICASFCLAHNVYAAMVLRVFISDILGRLVVSVASSALYVYHGFDAYFINCRFIFST